MPAPDRSTESYWVATSPGSRHPRLARDLEVDVAIVGGGITGITAALLLRRAGKRVAVLEARRIAEGVTGNTTAHLTEAIDTRYATLIDKFGLDGAKIAAEASRSGIEQIARLVDEKRLHCAFRRLPGYLYSEREGDLDALHAEYEAAKRVGLDVTMTREVPLPFPVAAGVCFADQAEFHVRDYLLPLCEEIEHAGGLVFEGTRVVDVEDGQPCRVVTEHGTVRARHVIVAANVPLSRVLLQTKIAHYRSYALAARVTQPRLSGLFWDTDDPYHYLRSVPSAPGAAGSVVIVGGEDHRTGTEEHTTKRYERLVAWASERFAVEEIAFRWSAQVIEPVDGLPLIGRSSMAGHVFVATGYSGNGMTFGTAAGMLLSDEVLGKKSPWKELFDATRVKPLAAAREFLTENAETGLHLVADLLRPAEASDVDEVLPGEGKIVRVKGKRLAVFRDATGVVTALSPVCPHLGCHVHFNEAERSWDCPCHGSRFDTQGKVINGPSTRGLEPVSLTPGDAADVAEANSDAPSQG